MYYSNSIEIATKSTKLVEYITAKKVQHDTSFSFMRDIIKIIRRFFLYIVILIPLLIMRVGLFFVYRVLKTAFKNYSFNTANPNNYSKMRKSYDSLDKAINKFNKSGLNELNDTNIKFGFRGLFNQIKNINVLITTHHSKLEDCINNLNTNHNNNSSFQYISEEKLWDQRTKAYNYRL